MDEESAILLAILKHAGGPSSILVDKGHLTVPDALFGVSDAESLPRIYADTTAILHAPLVNLTLIQVALLRPEPLLEEALSWTPRTKMRLPEC